MREEGDGLLEVIGARVVDLDVAGVAAVAAAAGEFQQADAAEASLGRAVVRPHKRVLFVGKVSSGRHVC